MQPAGSSSSTRGKARSPSPRQPPSVQVWLLSVEAAFSQALAANLCFTMPDAVGVLQLNYHDSLEGDTGHGGPAVKHDFVMHMLAVT